MAGSIKSQHRRKKTSESQKVFGEIIREMRVAKGLSRREFTTLTDLERSTIAYIELGKRQPSLNTIIELSYGLGIFPSELIRELEKRLGLDPTQD